MFTKPKPKQGEKLAQLTSLTRMKEVSQILGTDKFQSLLRRVETACETDRAHYEKLYVPLIHRVVAYLELLPESTHRFYTEKGGALEYALLRAEIALSLFAPYLRLADQASLSEEQSRWQYALFSAALCYGIGKLYLDYQIKLYQGTGALIGIWNPFLSDLISSAPFYKSVIQHEAQPAFRRRLNSTLAKTILPEAGFAFLVAEKSVFEAWLALLDDDIQGARVLGAILMYAESLSLNQSLEALLAKLSRTKTSSFHTFDKAPIDLGLLTGLAFLNWLKQQLASGDLALNDAGLTLNSEGLVLGQEIFKQFTKDQPTYKNWQAVQRGFLSLGFHDTLVDTAEILFTKFGIVLPSKVRFKSPYTDQATWVSAEGVNYFVTKGATLLPKEKAEDVMQVPSLSSKGVWQAEESPPSFLKPGMPYRG